jgi:hypothetical protein
LHGSIVVWALVIGRRRCSGGIGNGNRIIREKRMEDETATTDTFDAL